MRQWANLPPEMQTDEVKKYYDVLSKRRASLFIKRLFDVVLSAFMLIILFPIFLILAIAIKADSCGPIFYRQERVTTYGKHFRIHKFRTMVNGADRKGGLITVENDSRVTNVGKVIRKCRLDEISQLIDVFQGNMSFVGTRPEVVKYVERYTPAMMATLLLPAGITSEASILYKDEDKILGGTENIDDVYVEKILPGKMYYNLRSIEEFSLGREMKTMFRTLLAVLGRKNGGEYVNDVVNIEAEKI